MGAKTKIEWVDSSLNSIRARANGRQGFHCEPVSSGCKFCYSERMNLRLGTGLEFKPGHRQNGTVELYLDKNVLDQPLRWQKPRKVFICSTTDLFADFVPDEWIDDHFAMMALAPKHFFLVLTKRSRRMRDWRNSDHCITRNGVEIGPRNSERLWPNVGFGVSIEDQDAAELRLTDLLQTPAAMRFVSVEPMIGPVSLSKFHIGWSRCGSCGQAFDPNEEVPLGGREYCYECESTDVQIDGHHLHWVICGSESGPHARPMNFEWTRALKDECVTAGVPFFLKQRLDDKGRKVSMPFLDGQVWDQTPAALSS